VAHLAEAAAATRAIEMYPPPSVGPAADEPRSQTVPSVAVAGSTSAPHTVPTPDRVPIPEGVGAHKPESAGDTTAAHDIGPASSRTVPQDGPASNGPAVGLHRSERQTDMATPGGHSGGSGGRGALLAALVATTVVALGALGALAFVVLRDGSDSTPVGTDAVGDQDRSTTATGDEGTTADGGGTDSGGTDAAAGSDLDATPTVQTDAVANSAGGPIDLSSPVTIDGGIAVALDRQVFTFEGVAGEMVSAEIQLLNDECSSSNRWDLELSVLDPSGQVIDDVIDNPNCRDAYGPWVLPVDGEYSFVAAGGEGTSSRPATGTFRITVGKLLLVDTPVDLSSPVTIDGAVVIARDRQLFTFDAEPGQRISVQIQSLNGECSSSNRWDLEVFVIDATGSVIGEVEDNLNCSDAIGPWELPSAGAYSLVVAGGDGSSTRPATGTFQLTLATLQG
ncbi:MAG: hypothetical protein OEV40_31815, partial [Acidimicrobiia bacterium]|nr:hypothetical protein [Acidimicrobiia bacterium]